MNYASTGLGHKYLNIYLNQRSLIINGHWDKFQWNLNPREKHEGVLNTSPRMEFAKPPFVIFPVENMFGFAKYLLDSLNRIHIWQVCNVSI